MPNGYRNLKCRLTLVYRRKLETLEDEGAALWMIEVVNRLMVRLDVYAEPGTDWGKLADWLDVVCKNRGWESLEELADRVGFGRIIWDAYRKEPTKPTYETWVAQVSSQLVPENYPTEMANVDPSEDDPYLPRSVERLEADYREELRFWYDQGATPVQAADAVLASEGLWFGGKRGLERAKEALEYATWIRES